ncbi:MAG: hypothetical protein NT144_08975 [Bacteroidia bacterium]|nr:hypothetical protein [Bacteroidia bacterium]
MKKLYSIRNLAAGMAVLSINAGSVAASNNQSNPPKKKPNVIILFADQHNKEVMGFEW